MKAILTALAALALTGCASSGFKVANDENTKRIESHQEAMLEQAEKDLTAINGCYLRASGYAVLDGVLTKIGEPLPGDGCNVMAGMLRQMSTLLTAFQPHLVQPLLARVPAAPEEIAQSIIKDGMKYALTRYGLGAVERVVSSGQLAQTQLAEQAIQAAAKPTPNPVLITVPEGGSAGFLTADGNGRHAVHRPAAGRHRLDAVVLVAG
jgi:hypothetical protein